MNLQEQRIACLRMAMELGCTADSIVHVARELNAFIDDGTAPAPAEVAAEAPVDDAAEIERTADAIAACGTVLDEPLVVEEPADDAEAETATEAASSDD